MLTSALRSGGLTTTSVAEATPSRSPGVSSTAFRAQPPNLRFAPLMDMDFAISCPLVRRWRLVSGFCPSTRTFVPCFLQTPPRGDSPCIITRPYLHQVGRRTFTSKLLSMPSTQRSRFAADASACPEASDMEASGGSSPSPSRSVTGPGSLLLCDSGVVFRPPSKCGRAWHGAYNCMLFILNSLQDNRDDHKKGFDFNVLLGIYTKQYSDCYHEIAS